MATQKTVDGKKYRLVGGKWKRDYSFGSNWKSAKSDGTPRKKLNIKSKKTKYRPSETAFEKRQKGRPWFLQGKLNPVRIAHDTVRNVNYEKKRRKKLESKNSSKTTSKTRSKTGPNVKSVGTVDFNINTAGGLAAYNKALKASKDKKTDKEKDAATTEALHGERNREKAKAKAKGSNVFTRHYKTGKALGVMTKRQREAYDKEAAAAGGKTFEERVAAHEKKSGHGKPHKRETLYKASLRKKPGKKTGTHGKSLPSNPQLKTQTTKDKRDPNRHSLTLDKKKKKKKSEIQFPTGAGGFRGF